MHKKFSVMQHMPELPEVETLCRQLREAIVDKKIVGVEILDPRLGDVGELIGREVVAIRREGKALEMRLDNGTSLCVHLRMTGRMLWQCGSPTLLPHTRLVIFYTHGTLLCIDPRRFATVAITADGRPQALVKDPLNDFRIRELFEISCVKKVPVKSFLMDQRVVAGIGNIYACEILHEVSISPWRPSCKVSVDEWKKIEVATKKILGRAIACRGTTISDWRDLFGEKGEYQYQLSVYGREGLPCLRCQDTVHRLRLGGRGTFFCPSCQKR